MEMCSQCFVFFWWVNISVGNEEYRAIFERERVRRRPLVKRLRDLGKGRERQTVIKVAWQLKLKVKYLEYFGHTPHCHHQTIRWRVCWGEAPLIQLCPVAHQSYLPPPALLLSETVSLFSPHTSLPGNPVAFSQLLSFLTASLPAQTHSSPTGQRARE